MLKETVRRIRLLHQRTQVSHHFESYEVQKAGSIDAFPTSPCPIYVSG